MVGESQVVVAESQESSVLAFHLLTHLDQIEEIASEWQALVHISDCNRAFSSAAWFVAAYQSQAETALHVIVARRNGILAGVFPLVVDRKSRLAEFATVWNDYNDIVAASGDHAVVAGLLRHALTQSAACNRIALRRVRCDSNCFRALGSLFSEAELKKHFSEESTRYFYVPLSCTYSAYLTTLGKKFRKNLLSAKHKAATATSIRELHPSSFDSTLVPEIFLGLHLTRFGTRTAFSAPNEQAFVRCLLPRLFRDGSMRVWALFEMEEIVAIALYMVGPQGLCLWNGGFVAEAGAWSPGTLLIDAGLRSACDGGLAEYDFMRGGEGYKQKWAGNFRSVGSIELDAGCRTLPGACS